MTSIERTSSSAAADPPYIRIFRHIPGLRKANPTSASLLCLLVVPVLYEGVRLATRRQHTSNEIWCFYWAPAVTLLGAALLISAARKASRATTLMREIFTSESQQIQFEEDLERMFGQRVQNRFAIGGGALGVLIVVLLNPQLSPAYYWLLLVLAWLFFMMCGCGLGVAATAMWWIHRLPNYGTLQLSFIPARTGALRAASRLTGTFALYFAIEFSLGMLLFVQIDWANRLMYAGILWGIVAPIFITAILFLIYPQQGIMRLIAQRKHEIVDKLGAAMAEAFRDSTTDAGAILKLVELQQKVCDSPRTALDLETVYRYGSAFVIFVVGLMKDQISIASVVAMLKRMVSF